MEAADKVAVVERYVQAFAESNMDIIRDIFADDAVVEDPVGTEPHVGIEAIVGFYEPSLGAGVTLELTGTPRCTGNAVAFPFKVVMSGLNIEIIDVFQFNDDGKIIDMKAYWGPENTL